MESVIISITLSGLFHLASSLVGFGYLIYEFGPVYTYGFTVPRLWVP